MSRDGRVVQDAIGQYLESLDRYDLLTAEDEVRLAQAIEAGDEARRRLDTDAVAAEDETRLRRLVTEGARARDQFVGSNLRLVVANARRYASNEADLADLIQEGNLGLITAVEKFDWRRGFKFSTYATWWIRQAMQRAKPNLVGGVRVPAGVYELFPVVRGATDELRLKLRRPPTSEEIAELTGLTLRDVEKVQSIGGTVSLESPVGEDGATVADFVADDDALDPEDATQATLLSEAIEEALGDLTGEQRWVVDLRFGLSTGAPASIAQLCETTGLSQRRVSTLLAEASDQLRARLAPLEDMRVA